MNTTKIHGLIDPPLGYEYVPPGGKRCAGIKYLYEANWITAPNHSADDHPLEPGVIYCRPLNDGYEYFEVGTSVIQAGDELFCFGKWEPKWALGNPNHYPLRRPKAKPPIFTKGDHVEIINDAYTALGVGSIGIVSHMAGDCPAVVFPGVMGGNATLISVEYLKKVEPIVLTYAERQAACGLKVGDRVRVTRSASSYEDGWNASFNSTMENSVGKTGVIERDVGASGFSVRINHGCLWNYPYFVLEKVEERPETVTLWVFQGSSPSIHSTPYTVPLSQAAAIMALLEAMAE